MLMVVMMIMNFLLIEIYGEGDAHVRKREEGVKQSKKILFFIFIFNKSKF